MFAAKLKDAYLGIGIKQETLLKLFEQHNDEFLKKIGAQCGIKTRLTFHAARHCAATTILLSNGIPIETVSCILGHTNIKTTQIYAKITNQKISQDLEALSHKIGDLEKSLCSNL